MFCPNEDIEMHQVRIKSHYGQQVILEQCRGCGGIWFDESELFAAKKGEAEKTELLDSEILRKPSKIEKSILTCPRDQAELFRFNDRYFPKGIMLERCPNCSGIWLNRGDFTKFQKARQELRRTKEKGRDDEKIDDKIEQILASHQAGETTNTLVNLGRFLSAPIDRSTLQPLDSDESPPEIESNTNLALNVLMLILRAFSFR